MIICLKTEAFKENKLVFFLQLHGIIETVCACEKKKGELSKTRANIWWPAISKRTTLLFQKNRPTKQNKQTKKKIHKTKLMGKHNDISKK